MSIEATTTANQPPKAKPRVLVVVAGGVGYYVADDEVDVVIFDWDDYESDPELTFGPPQRFADLAERCNIPLASDRTLATQ